MSGFSLRFLLVSLLALSIGLPELAHAQNRAGSLTLTPLMGAHIFKDNEQLKNSAYYGVGLGYNLTENYGLELVGTWANVKDEAAVRDFDYYTSTLNLLYHFRPDKQFVPYLAVGAGAVVMEAGSGYNEDLLFNYGGGFKWFTTENFALRFDARHALRHEISISPYDNGKNYGNFLISTGLSFQFGGDKAPRAKSNDSDGDGVLDSVDRCPGTASTVFIDKFGCPLDSDGDGVIDDVDHCPETAVGAKVDSLGCPTVVEAVADADADGDGVTDINDTCPDTPVGMAVNALGCPMDSDLDGVFDQDDNCPQTPAGIQVGADGCPELLVAPATENFAQMNSMLLNIEFTSNSSKIDPKYADELRRAAEFSKAHPEKTILVEGHTDSTGSDKANQKLSQQRADSVRWLLIRDYGVDAKQVVAKGFGESQPVATNDTLDGRKSNRRVLVRLMD